MSISDWRLVRALAGILLMGCSTYAFQPVPPGEAGGWNAVNSELLSTQTMQYLRGENFIGACETSRLTCLLDLDTRLHVTEKRMIALYLAELSYDAGRREKPGSEAFARYHASAIFYASAFLFNEKLKPAAEPFDPAFRTAVDVYNASLGSLMRHEKSVRRPFKKQTIVYPLLRGEMQVLLDPGDLAYMPDSFLGVGVASDYSASGFQNHQRQYGIGAPLILFLKGNDVDRRMNPYRFIAGLDQTYAATAVLVNLQPCSKDSSQTFCADLAVVDPLKRDTVESGKRKLPLEIDLTLPLTGVVAQLEEKAGFFSRLDGDEIDQERGLYMIGPYDPSKTPVIMIHGLASSPMVWFPMINELLSDPVIRSRYQFWVYWYPSSSPILFSNLHFRTTMKDVHRRFGFKSTILVGHSMGGLLARLAVQNSRTTEWLHAADIKQEQFDAVEPRIQTGMRALLDFEPLPFVSRTIYIATPHRGSTLATGFSGYSGRCVMSVPGQIVEASSTLYKAFQDKKNVLDKLKTEGDGVSNLSPSSLLFRVMPPEKGQSVPFHSIIGNRRLTDLDWLTDSVVTYKSAHIEGAASEKLIDSDHSVEEHIEAFLEVRRILKEAAPK